MSTLARRVLPGMEGCINAILVVANESNASEVHLDLQAPGLKQLDELRTQLCGWIKGSLVAIGPEWVYDVALEPHFETGEDEIVVMINDPEFLGDRSVDLVLKVAEAFVAPFAAKHWRSIYTLKGEQRLVPLDFEQLADSIRVTLPDPLSLRAPKRFTARQVTDESLGGREDDMESPAFKCGWLKVALELAFDQYEWIADTAVRQSEKGVLVDVTFDLGVPPMPFNINAAQRVIMEVLKRHTVFTGINNDLVFVSATPASDNDYEYDGSDGYYEY